MKSIFDFCNAVNAKAQPCTQTDFDRIIKSDLVVNNCARIREIVEKIPADATEAQLKEFKNQIDTLKAGNKEVKGLPGFTFHAHYIDGRRSNASAEPSGLASIDLDHIMSPRECFEALREKAIAMKLAFAFITPSTHGLKLVLPVPEDCMNMEEAQQKIVKELGCETYFDEGTGDFARLAFAVPESYILYRDDTILFGDNSVPEGFGKQETVTLTQKELEEELPENQASERFIDCIPVAEIIDRICIEYCGTQTPPEGQRNNTLFKIIKGMRCFFDDEEELKEVVPTFGLSKQEYLTTMKSAFRHSLTQTLREEMDEMLMRMKREKAVENGRAVLSLPAPPKRLPPVFREFAKHTPVELRPAQMMSLLPILGLYGSMVKSNFAGNKDMEKWLTPSFFVVIIAPPASGKSVITNTKNLLTADLKLREKELLKQLNVYNKSKKDEDLPSHPILLMPERLSMTSMSFQLELAKEHHLFLFTPELDTLKTNNGNGSWSDLSTVFRKGIDNDEIGQIYMSGESRSCMPKVFLNMLVLSQPETFYEFFNKKTIKNGLDTRIIAVELPDNTGCREQTIRKFSELEMSNIMGVINRLQTLGKEVAPAEIDEEGNIITPAVIDRQVIELPKCRKALEAWGRQHQDHYLLNQANPAEDHYFRRAKQLAFHAAMVAFMCSDMKETNEVINFAVWVAEYILQSQMMFFGQTYNKLHEKRSDKKIDNIIAMTETDRFSLFDELAEEFTTEDMVSIMRKNGRTLKNPANKIHIWKIDGWIREIPGTDRTKRWRKVRDAQRVS